MPWLELTIQTSESYTEEISDFLEQANAVSITWQATDEEALFEPDLDTTPLWQRVSVSALFLETTATTALIDSLQQRFGEKAILHYCFKTIPDKVWERVWLNDFQAMRFGQRLWVCPNAFVPPDPSGITIHLDPGLAFGTGKHPSTALCLEWIEAHLQPQQTVIDYGCGSGILAIAALKCGAQHVFAIDHDPQALEATTANAIQNAIAPEKINVLFPNQYQDICSKQFFQQNRAQVSNCSESKLHKNFELLGSGENSSAECIKVDVVIANILAKPLINLATTFKSLIKKDGCCVLAGILIEQVENVLQQYVEQGFALVELQYKQNWASVVLRLR